MMVVFYAKKAVEDKSKSFVMICIFAEEVGKRFLLLPRFFFVPSSRRFNRQPMTSKAESLRFKKAPRQNEAAKKGSYFFFCHIEVPRHTRIENRLPPKGPMKGSREDNWKPKKVLSQVSGDSTFIL